MKNERKQFLKIPCLVLLIIFSVLKTYAQDKITLRGTVADSRGLSVIGAIVAVKGDNTKRTTTDADGRFTLTSIDPSATLVVTYLGMITKEVKVSGNSTIKITLQEDNRMLNEVVVVGYGQQKKESLVGAITQTSGKVLERTGGVTNLGQALTGNLPGVVTTTSSGMPGDENPEILIRAQTTWNNSSPLVLVDGVERPIGTVDISSVESISVLKDASATAVFGVKGANGVILITTKTGTAGKAVVRAKVNSTVKTVSRLPRKYDSYDGLSLKNRVIERELSVNPAGWSPSNVVPQEILLKYRFPANSEEWDRYPNVDWEKELLADYGMSYGANASISGGTKSVTYFASADYAHEGDIFKTFENNRGYTNGYSYDRINFRSNLDFNVTKTTKLSTKLFGSNGRRMFPWDQPANSNFSQNFVWSSAYKSAPDAIRPIYSDGTFGQYTNNFDQPNSVADQATAGFEQNTNTQLTTDFVLNQDLKMLTKGLSLRLNYSFDNTFLEIDRGIIDNNLGENQTQRKYVNPLTGQVTYTIPTSGTTGLDYFGVTNWRVSPGAVDKGQTYRRKNYSAQLNYNRSFAKHDLGLMGLFMREQIARGSVFPKYREDWVFRTTYGFASKYLLEANGAYNGSEQFGPDYRFAFFPSVSAGWVISNEKFMKKLEFINNLKLRGSWGKIGSDRLGFDEFANRYLYRDQWALGGNAAMGTLNQNSPYTYYRMTQLGNPNIAWENVEKRNIAVDFGFLKGLVAGSLDMFKDVRTDIIISGNSRAIPQYFGQAAPNANLGKVEGKGFELELRFNYKVNKDIRVWANTNMTRALNTVKFRDDGELLPQYQKQAGWQLGQVRSFLESAYLRSWDDVYGSTQRNSNDAFKLPGDYNIIDYNADGIINSFDQAPYGYSGSPQNTYNASLGFDWKALSLFAQFYGVNNVTRFVNFPTFFKTSSPSNVAFVEGTYYSPVTGQGNTPLPRWGADPEGLTGARYQFDGSYIRLKNVEVAYTLSGRAVNRLGVKSARLFVNGNNLWVWSKMPDDRESNFATAGSSERGSYPTTRRYNFGVDLNF
ncbi:SusC/RagA family TonB-linked outer membrane protein [Desertivirga arenae]|uniref:SusC/RagA family TonB-linked outer membrane protein n=1 Tax=Desertivirga arenae TaxID=2810309 RepID=UPI001F60F570|nr:TonB-dependent receptor [Pedobacter sp. SYSU D00823]